MPLNSVEAPGIKAEGALLFNMRAEVAQLLDRKSYKFPGAQPVSFSRRHLEELENQDYYVCEKSDGMRYLLYLTEDDAGKEIHYLIDRKNDYWFIPPGTFHCPHPRDHMSWHTKTLIDGELVMDRKPSGLLEAKYLVFDCMMLDGKSLMNRTLDKRLAYFKECVFDPYDQILRDFPEEIPHQHFIMEMKSMQFSYAIEMMFKQILPSLPHGNDGLIFTCRMSEYKFGTDQNILKWKPQIENSIDFKLKLEFPLVQPDSLDIQEGFTEPYYDYDALPICNLHIYEGDNCEDPWYSNMYLEPSEWESLKLLQQPLNDRIVECYMDQKKRWRFMRFRDDKITANHSKVVRSVLESIQDPVSDQELMIAAPRIREKWKQREGLSYNKKKVFERKAVSNLDGSNAPPTGTKRKADEQGSRQLSIVGTGRI